MNAALPLRLRAALALALCLAATFVSSGVARAQSGEKTPPPPAPRAPEIVARTPQPHVHVYGQVIIGERAPDFSLDGADGRIIRLARFKGDWVLIVFADRKETLAPLGSIDEELRGLGVRLLGVCHEKSHTLQTFAARDSLHFALGADFSTEVSALYGLFDTQRSVISPGFLLIDREGIVRMALLGQNLPPDHIARLARYAVTGL
jgi:peroxiredoxin